jgi:cysteine synthase
VNDRESFLMERRLVREEGIFSGGSSGSAVAGTLKSQIVRPAPRSNGGRPAARFGGSLPEQNV